MEPKKKTKKPTVWEFGGKNDATLDFSKKDENTNGVQDSSVVKNIANSDLSSKDIDMQPELDFDTESDDDEEEEEEMLIQQQQQVQSNGKKGFFGSIMNSFSYNKTLTKADLDPILSNLKDHLIAKNVAAEIAHKLCDSVATKLEGQAVNTWLGLKVCRDIWIWIYANTNFEIG